MDELNTMTASGISDWVKLIGATGVGGLIAAFFAKFTFRKFAEEDTATQRAVGETDIIEHLRKEVDRLAQMNETLSKTIAELQGEIVALRNENADLSNEVRILNHQIQNLQQQHQACSECPRVQFNIGTPN